MGSQIRIAAVPEVRMHDDVYGARAEIREYGQGERRRRRYLRQQRQRRFIRRRDNENSAQPQTVHGNY